MGVGSVASMNDMSAMQMTMARSKDVKSKKIENEITGIRQQMQKISSKEDLSVDEKASERKKQQNEISSLNTELERRQEELLRTQKREAMIAELQQYQAPVKKNMEQSDTSTQQADSQGIVIFRNSDGTVLLKGASNQDEKRGAEADKKQADETNEEAVDEKQKKAADEEPDTDTGLSHKEVYEMISADTSARQTAVQGTAAAKIKNDIAVLKGEINQDKRRGIDTDRKQEELEKLEKKEEQARTFRLSGTGREKAAVRPATKFKVSGVQTKAENKAIINISSPVDISTEK